MWKRIIGIVAVALNAASPSATAQGQKTWAPSAQIRPCVTNADKKSSATMRTICADLLGSGLFSGSDAEVLRLLVLVYGKDAEQIDDVTLIDGLWSIPTSSLPNDYILTRTVFLSEACGRQGNWDCALGAYEGQWSIPAPPVTMLVPFASAIIKAKGTSARQYVEGIFQQDPNWLGSYLLRSVVRQQLGDLSGGHADMKMAADHLTANNQEVANFVCWRLVTTHASAAEAARSCDIAVSGSRNEAAYWDSRGMMYLASGQHHRALEDFDRALSIDSQIYHSRFGRSLALEGLGRNAEAQREREIALAGNEGLVELFTTYRLTRQPVSATVSPRTSNTIKDLSDSAIWTVTKGSDKCRLELRLRKRYLLETLIIYTSFLTRWRSGREVERYTSAEWEFEDPFFAKLYKDPNQSQVPAEFIISSDKRSEQKGTLHFYAGEVWPTGDYVESQSIKDSDARWIMAGLSANMPTRLTIAIPGGSKEYLLPPLRENKAEIERCEREATL